MADSLRLPMPNKATIRSRLERALRHQIIGRSFHGHRDCTDIERSGCRISVIFDIGAKVGQSADKFGLAFPDARIHSFEPVSGTFRTRQQHLKGRPNVSCHRLAIGNRDGQATLYLTGAPDANSVTNSLLKPAEPVGSETVEIRTVDTAAAEKGITRIDLLKIDTEGADLDVLMGARQLLSSGKVAFVLAEIGFLPGDARHVLFDDVRSYLLPFGFSVFGIYDQQLEWSGEQRLRFASACFPPNRHSSGPERLSNPRPRIRTIAGLSGIRNACPRVGFESGAQCDVCSDRVARSL